MKFRSTIIALASALLFGFFTIGCRDETPPPARVAVPPPSAHPQRYPTDEVKPLPQQGQPENFQPPFEDVPLVSQQPPEQPAFVDAYRRVNSPRITLFVNRTMEGKIIPLNGGKPAADYLQHGQYDEAQAKSLDYEALETIMTDWLAANGKVTIISPSMARQRLTDQEVKELQEGRPRVLSEIAQKLGADVLVQVQAHPTKQTERGLEVRIVAEAINTHGGQSIGRAVVDVPPPLVKTTLNEFTRYLARKLMMDMTETWNAPPPADMQAPANAPPTTQPER